MHHADLDFDMTTGVRFHPVEILLSLLIKLVVIALLVVGAFVVIPFVATPYVFTGVLIPFLILSLAALGLNILTGYAGQLSLGTAAFMAVGAFASYNFILRIPGIPMLVAGRAGFVGQRNSAMTVLYAAWLTGSL